MRREWQRKGNKVRDGETLQSQYSLKRIHVLATTLKDGWKSFWHFFERAVFHLTFLYDFVSTPFFETSIAGHSF